MFVCDASATIVVMPAYVADLFYAIYGLSLAAVLHGTVVCCKQHSAVDYAHFVQHNLSARLCVALAHAADRARMQHYMMPASTCPGYVQPPLLRDRSAHARDCSSTCRCSHIVIGIECNAPSRLSYARLCVLLIHNLCNALTPNKLPANVNDGNGREREYVSSRCYMLTQRATNTNKHNREQAFRVERRARKAH